MLREGDIYVIRGGICFGDFLSLLRGNRYINRYIDIILIKNIGI